MKFIVKWIHKKKFNRIYLGIKIHRIIDTNSSIQWQLMMYRMINNQYVPHLVKLVEVSFQVSRVPEKFNHIIKKIRFLKTFTFRHSKHVLHSEVD